MAEKKKEPELTQVGMIAGPAGRRDLGRTVFEDEDGNLFIQGEEDEKPKKV